MAEPHDLTVEILREIRDEIRTTNTRLDRTREDLAARIDQTNARLDQTNARLDRLDEAMLDLAQQQRFVVRYVKTIAERPVPRVEEVDDLRRRVESLETRMATG